MGRTRTTKWKRGSAFLERLRHLLVTRWDDNIAAMSRALHITHPVMSRIMSGKQEPTGRLFMALVDVEDIDLHWLFRGAAKAETDPLAEIDRAISALNAARSVIKKR